MRVRAQRRKAEYGPTNFAGVILPVSIDEPHLYGQFYQGTGAEAKSPR
jgi:hypothetical protein